MSLAGRCCDSATRSAGQRFAHGVFTATTLLSCLLTVGVALASASAEPRPAQAQLRGSGLSVESAIPTREDDPAYWTERLQAAMLPGASLRARLNLESAEHGRVIKTYSGTLVRVEGPSGIRSVLAIEKPIDDRRVEKVESSERGGADQALYVNRQGEPISLHIDASERILLTSLTYEDLGFVPLTHRAGDEVEFEASRDRAIVRLVSRPYGTYGRVVTRLDRKTALPIETEYFDKRGTLVRRVTYSKVAHEAAYAFPLRIRSEELRTGRTTTVDLSDVELGAPIYEYEFSDAHLRNLS